MLMHRVVHASMRVTHCQEVSGERARGIAEALGQPIEAARRPPGTRQSLAEGADGGAKREHHGP
jgi:hypothetical protein